MKTKHSGLYQLQISTVLGPQYWKFNVTVYGENLFLILDFFKVVCFVLLKRLFKALGFPSYCNVSVCAMSNTCKVTECINVYLLLDGCYHHVTEDTVCLNAKAKPPLAI